MLHYTSYAIKVYYKPMYVSQTLFFKTINMEESKKEALIL